VYLRDALANAQQALSFLVEQTAKIETEVYKQRYPDIQFQSLIPVDTSGPEWVRTITFFSSDMVGKADWYHHLSKDIPRADVARQKFDQSVEMAAIGYGYTLAELGEAMAIPGMNLTMDRADAARRAALEFIDQVTLFGATTKQVAGSSAWHGMLNHPDVTAEDAPADGTGSSNAWADKTPDQVIRDFNNAITAQYTETLTVEIANTVLLPVAVFTNLATRRLTDTNMTILQFLLLHNVYTAQTGQPLTIRAVRGLEDAGDGGTGRAVFYRNEPRVLKLHMPMPHRFLPIWQTGPIQFEVPGIFRLGGVDLRLPKAMRYLDAVSEVGT
jgi:hypothetical protein